MRQLHKSFYRVKLKLYCFLVHFAIPACTCMCGACWKFPNWRRTQLFLDFLCFPEVSLGDCQEILLRLNSCCSDGICSRSHFGWAHSLEIHRTSSDWNYLRWDIFYRSDTRGTSPAWGAWFWQPWGWVLLTWTFDGSPLAEFLALRWDTFY